MLVCSCFCLLLLRCGSQPSTLGGDDLIGVCTLPVSDLTPDVPTEKVLEVRTREEKTLPKRIGHSMKKAGFRPYHPIVIIPGKHALSLVVGWLVVAAFPKHTLRPGIFLPHSHCYGCKGLGQRTRMVRRSGISPSLSHLPHQRLSLGRLGSVKFDSITANIRRNLFPRVVQSSEEAQLSKEDKAFRVHDQLLASSCNACPAHVRLRASGFVTCAWWGRCARTRRTSAFVPCLARWAAPISIQAPSPAACPMLWDR